MEVEETVAETVDAPAFTVAEPVMQVAQITVELSPILEQPEQPKEQEVEDEDDKIIKGLSGGIWGTPFFKAIDPIALPEHFQEALTANAATTPISASSPYPAVETEEAADKDRHNVYIIKDEIITTVGGSKLIEAVVETTEDTSIEAADGAFLEESITTSVEDTISGGTHVVVEDKGAIAFVETILEQADADDTKIVSITGTLTSPEVTMTKIETVTSVQGENDVETTIVEDTLTILEGPEVDTGSLHSLTTGVKPVTEDESAVVEQSPEVVVAAAAPSQETPSPPTPSTVVEPLTPIPASSNNKDSQDAESAVMLLPHAGDAQPTADLSVATAVLTPTPVMETKSTLAGHLVPAPNLRH